MISAKPYHSIQIDAALLRPGRLDKCVQCPLPSLDDRLEILKAHARNLVLHEDIQWNDVASMTEYFSGADLKALLTNAQLLAINDSGTCEFS